MWAAINRHVNKVPDSTWVRSGRLLRGGDFETGPLKTRRSSSGREARNGVGERMAEPRMAALWEMTLERTSKAKCPN